jgi:hypothetical protein
MLTLGDILALSGAAAADLDRLGLPPELVSAVRAAAAAEAVTPDRFLRRAVADFAETAGPDDWTTLMSGLRDSPDPGAACLRMMLERRLASASEALVPAGIAEENRADVRRDAAAKAGRAGPGA